jgi:glycosidase
MYAFDPHYGSLADLQALAAELHRRHIPDGLDFAGFFSCASS